MAVTIKKDLKHLNNYIRNLKNIDKYLFQAAGDIQTTILENWSQGKGSNEKTMKALTKSYKIKKIASGRVGKRTLNWSGDLYRSFIIKKLSKVRMALTFTADSMGKAIGNYLIDNRMMKASKKLAEQGAEFIYRKIFPK